MSEVAEKVKKIIAEHLGIDDMEKITNDAKFIDDLGADSLDTVELVMAFEEAFDVEIPDEKAETILTVSDAISFGVLNQSINYDKSSRYWHRFSPIRLWQ